MKRAAALLGFLSLVWIGCGGNVVVGSGGGGDTSTVTVPSGYAACGGPGECVLLYAACCGACELPEAGDYVALNGAYTEVFRQQLCPEPVACPDCVTPVNPNLFAFCDAGQCAVADVRAHAVSACQQDADCQLRAGAECCEPCGQVGVDQLTSVSTTAGISIQELVCAPNTGCSKCAIGYPQAIGVCGDDGHCRIEPAGG